MRLAVILVSFVLFSETTVKAWSAEEVVIPSEIRKKIPIEFYPLLEHKLWGPVPYESLLDGKYVVTVVLDQKGAALIKSRDPAYPVFLATGIPEEIRTKGKEFQIRK